MEETRNIRINRVLREFNISLEKAITFLRGKGITIESNPNTKITQKEYQKLRRQFGKSNMPEVIPFNL